MNLHALPAHRPSGRLEFIDGLRGIAILSVMLFHAFAGWPGAVPYGDQFATIWLFKYGWLGVQLFFLISGFVIFMTLEKCDSFPAFMARRWLRLFPAMLACSLFIYLTAPFFPERPAGQPLLRDLIPGLTFLEPSWWEKLLGSPQGSLEGAFWSLFVEAKFYVVFGALYFLTKRRYAIQALALIFLLWAAHHLALEHEPALIDRSLYLTKVFELISARSYGWFAAGALYYRFFHERKGRLLLLAFLTALASALTMPEVKTDAHVAALVVVCLFTAAVFETRLKKALSCRFLLFMGFVSYPLYLLHENLTVSLIARLGVWSEAIPALALPILPFMLVVGFSAVVALYAEPWLKNTIRRPMRRVRAAEGSL
ncbi:MAG: acyltransferase [Alphaproteobacteria bacterium]|nr:acyltransferase [Alphaproteobacteria bacterium]